jgi:signal transduction histidine kinase
LASAYARLDAVLESTSDSVMTIGYDWALLYGNRKTIEGLPDFKLGEVYWDCFPSVVGTPVEERLRNAMTQRTEAKYESYFPLYQKWHKVHVYPTDEGLTIFFCDNTEEKKMQEKLELEQMMREKRIEALSHMAGGLAHEISNPLAIIHARASDLQREATEEEMLSAVEVKKIAESIVSMSDRAMRILRGLRGFGREAGNDPMEPASMYDIVEECVELQQARLERHSVLLRVELGEDLPLVICRATQIGQIVTNLLNNALDAVVAAHTEECWISLMARYGDGFIEVDVTDSGAGIEEQHKARLMEPFFTTKGFEKGTGIGLSLSRAIAQEHGGTLTLCDETQRTCFRLVLPVAGNEGGQDGTSGR